MRIAGWRNRTMLDRYGRSVTDERALAAHRRHGPAPTAFPAPDLPMAIDADGSGGLEC